MTKICKILRTASFCHSLVVPSEPEIVGIPMLCHSVTVHLRITDLRSSGSPDSERDETF